MAEFPLNVRYVLDSEWMETLCEMAGYGIKYWADRCYLTPIADKPGNHSVFTVEWRDVDTGPRRTRQLSYGLLARSVQRILTDPGAVQVGEHMLEAVQRAVFDAGDIDADVADVVIQVAVFTKVIYG